jgi:hypothetical protein
MKRQVPACPESAYLGTLRWGAPQIDALWTG